MMYEATTHFSKVFKNLNMFLLKHSDVSYDKYQLRLYKVTIRENVKYMNYLKNISFLFFSFLRS